jgi:hypothetical protein
LARARSQGQRAVAQAESGSLAAPSPAYADAGAAAPSGAVAERPPLVYVEVNIAPGRPPERLALRDGQDPAEAAADFAVQHHLAPHLAQRLHVLLQDLLTRPQSLQSQSATEPIATR